MSLLPTDPKARKQLQLWTFLMGYFPRTFLAVVEVARKGNEQHNPGEPLHWAREKSTDQMNAAFNHLFDYGSGTKIDTDGARHLAKAIWRLAAQNELDEEGEAARKVQPAPTEANGSFTTAASPLWHCNCGEFMVEPREAITLGFSHHSVGGCSNGEISTTGMRSTI